MNSKQDLNEEAKEVLLTLAGDWWGRDNIQRAAVEDGIGEQCQVDAPGRAHPEDVVDAGIGDAMAQVGRSWGDWVADY